MGSLPLAGLVLAGGRSRRMGTDKALLVVEGEALVVRVARRLSAAADPVLVATGTAGRLGALGFAEVGDRRPGSGPLGGLVAGLEASPHELMAVVAVDLPFASPSVVSLLASLWSGEDAVVPLQGGLPQPLHAVYAASALPSLRAALGAGRPRVLHAVDGLRVRAVAEAEWAPADPDATFAVNLNRPEDVDLAGLRPARAGPEGVAPRAPPPPPPPAPS